MSTTSILAMHIPDGFMDPATAVATGVVAIVVVAVALRVAKDRLDDRQVPLVGVTAAFVFAVQMINFPVGLGTTGHLIGGALAAILLGPWTATLVLAVVLLVQALGFGDGGITALGANITLMGVFAGFVGGYLYRALAHALPRSRGGYLTAVGIASWVSVVGASALCSLFITFGGIFGASEAVPVFATMIGLHALIGIGEAVITVAAVSAVLATRPDLIEDHDLLPEQADRGAAVAA